VYSDFSMPPQQMRCPRLTPAAPSNSQIVRISPAPAAQSSPGSYASSASLRCARILNSLGASPYHSGSGGKITELCSTSDRGKDCVFEVSLTFPEFRSFSLRVQVTLTVPLGGPHSYVT